MNNKNKPKIYMDHNATTQTRPEVIEAMIPYYGDIFGNASSVHQFGKQAHKGLDEAREKVAKLINAAPDEIVFTSCGSESNNYVIKGIAFNSHSKGNHIITSCIEHLAVLEVCKYLEKKGFEVTYLPAGILPGGISLGPRLDWFARRHPGLRRHRARWG